jgi:Fe-S-cluster containining protein
MAELSTWDAQARRDFADASSVERLGSAVLRFHRRLDEVIDASRQGHAVKLACAKGCGYCCNLQVEVQPHETFALAAFLRRTFDGERLARVTQRLRENAARTREMGDAARKRVNIACALLGDDGACSAYEARPAQCRRFHSTRLDVCKTSHANPADDTVASPMHPALAHNAAVIITQAQHAVRGAGLDATPMDMNLALLSAIDNPKSWRRWRDGKKPFVSAVRATLATLGLAWAGWGSLLLAELAD